MDLVKCFKISMQLNLEEPNTHALEKKYIHHLCSAFHFWYKTFSSDEDTFHAYIYFPANNYLYHSDFNSIIKTYALQHGYYILHSEITEIPYSDSVCLDAEDILN